jgi:preprotein translocase subunit YajC
VPDVYAPIFLAQDSAPAAPPAPAGGPPAGAPPAGAPPAGDAPAGGTTAPGGAGDAPSSSPLGGMLPMLVVMFLIFYVVMIRPQSKDRKKREEQIRSLQKGDKVVTTAGLHGEVVATDDARVRLEVDDGVRLWFDRVAIWKVTPKDAPAPAPEKDKPKS